MKEQQINDIMSVTDSAIKGFFGEYGWLSNFHSCHVEYDGQVYQSSEAAYQAAKTLDLVQRALISRLTASESKKAGRKLQIRSDWDSVKYEIMQDILICKFVQNPGLEAQLIATGDKYLEETNWWGDTYWGVCDGKGENNLGKLLMIIRESLKLTK